jgi:hypothetical protein
MENKKLVIALSILVAIFGLGFVGVGSLLALLYGHSAYQIRFVPITLLTNLLPYNWLVITGFLSLAIPGVFAFIIGLMITTKKKLLNLKASGIMLGLWLIASIIFIALCLRYLPEVSEARHNYPAIKRTEQTLDLKGVKHIQADGLLLDVYVSDATDTPAMIKGRKVDFDQIQVKRQGDQLLLQEIKEQKPNQMCFQCELDPVRVSLPTSTAFTVEAKNYASLEYAQPESDSEDDDRTGDLTETATTTEKCATKATLEKAPAKPAASIKTSEKRK